MGPNPFSNDFYQATQGDCSVTTEVDEQIIRVPIEVPKPHSSTQEEFVRCTNLRQIVKAGRRWGKTVGVAIKGLEAFLGICPVCGGERCSYCDNTGHVRPKRVVYGAPTAEQVGKFWFEITSALNPAIEGGYLKKDETEHFIEVPGTEQRIKAKTAWNANTFRGDYGDLVILEEYQLWNEDAWDDVIQPMLLDNNGTAVFIFTPPSLRNEGVSKAKDPRHASKMFNKAEADKRGIWKTFHFTSFDNPVISTDALKLLAEDMARDSYRREILAEDDEIELSWLVYGMFDEELCKIKPFIIPETWPVWTGHDFGTANPAALFVAEVKLPLPTGAPKYMRYGDYVAFKEYAPGAGFSAIQHVDKFKEFTKDRNLAISVGGNVTTEEEIRQLYCREGWLIKVPTKNKVNTQIDLGIKLMEQKRFYVFEDLYRLLAQIADCMWVLDLEKRTTNKVKDDSKYHLLACFRYLATVLNTKVSYDDEVASRSWDDYPSPTGLSWD